LNACATRGRSRGSRILHRCRGTFGRSTPATGCVDETLGDRRLEDVVENVQVQADRLRRDAIGGASAPGLRPTLRANAPGGLSGALLDCLAVEQ
jgi:hypothetical protein